jgi:hypothetical protein
MLEKAPLDLDADELTVTFRMPAGPLLDRLRARARANHISRHAAARELLLKALGSDVQDRMLNEMQSLRMELTRLALEISHLQFHLAPGHAAGGANGTAASNGTHTSPSR